jgi:hypothetical protein
MSANCSGKLMNVAKSGKLNKQENKAKKTINW